MNRRQFILSLLGTAAGQMLCSPAISVAVQKPRLRIAVISDLNLSYGTIGYDSPVRAVIQRIITLQPDLVLCTGDMIAGQRTAPKLKRKRLESMWRSFHETITKPLQRAGIPLAPAPGNHDASASPGFQLERDLYREQWEENRPDLAFLAGGRFPFYYAFSMNGILFASLDATVTAPLGAAQTSWLKTILAAGRNTAVARIVFGHIPLHPLTIGRKRSFLRDPDLEQLFTHTSVSVYLSGHQHGFYPFYHNRLHCVGQAALGSGPRRLIGDKKRSPRAFTLIEVSDNGVLKISAYTGPDFKQLLPRTTLPKRITANGVTIMRDDLKK